MPIFYYYDIMGRVIIEGFRIDYFGYEIEILEVDIGRLVFPSAQYMQEWGWKEVEVDIYSGIEINDIIDEENGLEKENDNKIREALSEYFFGEDYEVLNTEELVDMIMCDLFYPEAVCVLKNERVGKFLEYAEKHPSIKKTKIYKQIEYCMEVIAYPFYVYYPGFSDYKVVNGCFYGLYASGYFIESPEGEYISSIHGKMSRKLCVAILHQLLVNAEEKYNYIKASS